MCAEYAHREKGPTFRAAKSRGPRAAATRTPGSPRPQPGSKNADMADRIVHCRLLKKDLPGLDRQPYKNDLGRRIYEEVSKEAWQQWLKDSVKYINTYRVDLASPEG